MLIESPSLSWYKFYSGILHDQGGLQEGENMTKQKTVVAGALGECVHVAGVTNFLRLAESAGWRTIFLGPSVSIDEMLKVARRENADMVGVSYRLTPETGERLLGELALHALDIVLADTAIPSTVRILGHSHLLGESGVSLFASSKLATKYKKNFPKSLNGAPFLVPTSNAMLRRGMDEWFSEKGITPRVVGEFEDGATMKAFGQAGKGIFPGSSVVAKEISRQYLVQKISDVPEIREQFYALSVERRLKHPGVLAIVDSAQKTLFRTSKSL